MSFNATFDPTLIQFSIFQIRYYGLFYVLGFLFVLWYLNYQRKKGFLNLTPDQLEDFLLDFMIGIVVGSRLGEVFFWEPGFYLANPIKIFYVWEGGLSFHGGLIGAILATIWFCKRNKFSILEFADVLVIPASAALALGRIGNLINGEIYGPPTSVPWCAYFPGVEACRHPSQLYGAIGRALLAIYLYTLSKKSHKTGFIFWNFIWWLGIGRFFADYLREDTLYFGLSIGQYLSLVMVLVSGIVLYRHYLSKK